MQEEETMGVNQVEMVRQALLELDEVSSQELAAFLEQRQGVRIEVRIIPILKASVRGQEVLERARQAARAAIQTAKKPGGDSKSEDARESFAAST
jgi:hypothetical protein